jgi:tetratricopeptide (TPR) repeat protein
MQNSLGVDALESIVLDLINNDQRSMAWQLIDHYFARATSLKEFDILGLLSIKADKRDTYLRCAEITCALAKDPDALFTARFNLIKAYNTMNRPEDALLYIDMNLRIDPENFELQCQRAFNISLQGDKKTAEKILEDLESRYPEHNDTLQAVFSGKHLREGRTFKGILSFLTTNKARNKVFEDCLTMSKWTGIITPGKKLYVDIEGGIGDQILNIRFFDRLQALGMKPILVSHDKDYYAHINKLLIRHNYTVITDHITIDRKAFWTPMMTLPAYLGLDESGLWQGPYLKPLMQSKNLLSGSRPRIGIKCSGNPYFAQDEYRKIPLDVLLTALPEDVDIYYIDIDDHYKNDPRVISLSDRINDWEDTLDFVAQMDCIVSSCTSLVHAAGAMGHATFVAVPIAEYYIWTSTRTDGSSPWYGPNVFVAKQTKLRDWTDPMLEIRQQVNKLLGSKIG